MKKLMIAGNYCLVLLFLASSVSAEPLSHFDTDGTLIEPSPIVVAETQYTKDEIIKYFTDAAKNKTRSIPPRRTLENIIFEYDSAVLTQQAKLELDEWGSALTDSAMIEMVFKVAGHTDDVGSHAYNLELSERRAEAVKSYLVSKFNMSTERLSIEALGESEPLIRGTSPKDRAKNRRVEFIQIER